MKKRNNDEHSKHNGAVYALQDIFQRAGRVVWVNPGSEKNKEWSGRYIDVIVQHQAQSAWVIEIETKESITEDEAKQQWVDYASVYQNWYLAVPINSKSKAELLLNEFGIDNCSVLAWRLDQDDSYTFWGLPGIN